MYLIFNPQSLSRMKLATTMLGFTAVLLACGGGGADNAKYTVGGTLNGLVAGQSVRVKDANSGQQVTLNANGRYIAIINVSNGTTYSLSITAQPEGQLCSFSNASGAVVSSDVSTITISCSNTLNLLAGNVGGAGNTDGFATNASFQFPTGMATDSAGNIYVADVNNHTIRKITPQGDVSTFAGSAGQIGSTDGTGTLARFNFPDGLAIDRLGNLYVADTNNHTIRKITPAGVVSTFAGNAGQNGTADGAGAVARFSFLRGLTIDSAGNLFVADTNNHTIRKIDPQGEVSTFAGSAGSIGSMDGTGTTARFHAPRHLATDSANNVYVSDTFNSTIRKISSEGEVSTFAGRANQLGSADGSGMTARFYYPHSVATDTAGNLYVADNFTIRKIGPLGLVNTFAGSATQIGSADGTGIMASFKYPSGVATDKAGNVYVADTYNRTIRKINSQGVVTTLAGLAAQQDSTDGAGALARFSTPRNLAADSTGNLYVADTSTIRKIDLKGHVSTFAGRAGIIDNSDGVGSSARFGVPSGIGIDYSGVIYVADSYNNTIRRITPQASVSTFAGSAGQIGSVDGASTLARFNSPQDIATDQAGNLYVADAENSIIRKINAQGAVSTFAGSAGQIGFADGTGTLARFNRPRYLTIDSSGSLFVADTDNHTIRKISAQGVVSTFAGSAGLFGSTDGSGAAARFNSPSGLAIDSTGNLYVADLHNHVIRKINPQGVATTVVGRTGSQGVSLTTLPASLTQPLGISLHNGKLFITTNNGVVWTYAP
jgi:sugar lactone lactonase YvrE